MISIKPIQAEQIHLCSVIDKLRSRFECHTNRRLARSITTPQTCLDATSDSSNACFFCRFCTLVRSCNTPPPAWSQSGIMAHMKTLQLTSHTIIPAHLYTCAVDPASILTGLTLSLVLSLHRPTLRKT